MPAHTSAWNNLSPVGSDLASSIDDFMRAMKVDVDERMSLAHYWGDAIAVGNNQDGTHKEITITPATTNTPILKTNANQSLTGSDASAAIDLGITWNTTGAPTAIKANITNTASGAAALLMDLQIGGTTVFKVSKGAVVTLTGTDPKVTFAGSTTNTIVMSGVGLNVPTFTTRSVGTKIVLYDSLSGSLADYAIGVNSNLLWHSVANSNAGYGWYAGTTSIMSLSGAGQLTVSGNILPLNVILPNNAFYNGTTTGAAVTALLGLDSSNNAQVGAASGISSMNFRASTSFTWSLGATTYWNMISTAFYPQTPNTVDVGGSSNRVRTIYGVNLDVLNAGGAISGSGGGLIVPGAITSQNGDILVQTGQFTAGNTFGSQGILNGAGVAAGARVLLQAGPSLPGTVELETGSTTYSVWVDSSGRLRIGSSGPSDSAGNGGTIVGTQL